MIFLVWPAEWLKMKMKISISKSIIPQLRCLADLQTLSSAFVRLLQRFQWKCFKSIIQNQTWNCTILASIGFQFDYVSIKSLSCSNKCQVTALNSHCALHRLTAIFPHSKESFAHRETVLRGENASAISIIHNIWLH